MQFLGAYLKGQNRIFLKIMNAAGEYNFNQRPEGDMRMIQFMHTIGSIKVKPESWNDLLFPMPGK